MHVWLKVFASPLLPREAAEGTRFPQTESSGIKLETCIRMHRVGELLIEKPHG